MASSLAVADSDVPLAVFVHQEHDSTGHLAAYSKADPLVRGWSFDLEIYVAEVRLVLSFGDSPSEADVGVIGAI